MFSRAARIGSMSPTRLSLGMVASLQSPLPFHLVSLFRLSGSISPHASSYKDKRYWPSSWRMSPCWEAREIASWAVRLEHCVRCMISSRSWL